MAWYTLKVQNNKEVSIANLILELSIKNQLDYLILDVGYPRNVISSKNDYQGYLFINLNESITKEQIQNIVYPFLKTISGIYGFVGYQKDTGTYRKQIIRENKREKVKNVRIYHTDPEQVKENNIVSLKKQYEKFHIQNNLKKNKTYRVVKKLDKIVYQEVQILESKDNKVLVKFNNGVRMYCTKEALVTA